MLVQNIMFLACICSVMPEIVIAGRDYYEVLGLTRGATDRQIKKAYRKLVMQYHPDKNKDTGAEEKFREIVTAYEVLSDEEKKRKYDQFGEAAFGNGGQPHGQAFSFDFQEIFKKFNEHPFDKRNSQYHGDFGGFHFDDMFSEGENAWGNDHGFGNIPHFGSGDSFFGQHFGQQDRHGSHFSHHQRAEGRTCRTVTQRVGNMVSTYTQCS